MTVAELKYLFGVAEPVFKSSQSNSTLLNRKIFLGKVNPAAPPAMKARREAKKEVNRLREEEAENKRLRRQLKKLEAVKAKLESAGITTSALNLSSQMPSTGKTPVMQVDEDMSPDITLKTPPHVKKIKSRDESIGQILFFKGSDAIRCR